MADQYRYSAYTTSTVVFGDLEYRFGGGPVHGGAEAVYQIAFNPNNYGLADDGSLIFYPERPLAQRWIERGITERQDMQAFFSGVDEFVLPNGLTNEGIVDRLQRYNINVSFIDNVLDADPYLNQVRALQAIATPYETEINYPLTIRLGRKNHLEPEEVSTTLTNDFNLSGGVAQNELTFETQEELVSFVTSFIPEGQTIDPKILAGIIEGSIFRETRQYQTYSETYNALDFVKLSYLLELPFLRESGFQGSVLDANGNYLREEATLQKINEVEAVTPQLLEKIQGFSDAWELEARALRVSKHGNSMQLRQQER